jgi:antirestriction protein ArdC
MTKKTVYDIVTEKIIEQLEQGIIPWQQPWVTTSPRNLVSGRAYRGINPILLQMRGFSSPYWVSYKQCTQLGGQVKKGEKATPVVFWTTLDKKEKDAKTGQEKNKKMFILRYYSVFNIEQCEGLKTPDMKVIDFVPVERAEEIVTNYPGKPEIKAAADAHYVPSTDVLGMPKRETFKSVEMYYSVLFHELVHSTGAKHRLDRGFEATARFGSESYSKEELVAEFGAAFLCAEAGISNEQTSTNSAAYIQNWLKKLKQDSRLVVMAAAQAQKASDYILDRKAEVIEEN